MLDFRITHDPKTHEEVIETSLFGKALLTIPQLNKGTAFTPQERQMFGLLGKLPFRVETLDEQVERAYEQYSSYKTRLKKHIYLTDLHDKNQVLFYKLLSVYLSEMLPIVYTPIIGKAVKRFSREYRQPRGLYITYSDKDRIEEIMANRTNPDISLIVVTDGEGVLGIGDQGIGGMDIPVAKLMVYTVCGGINPTHTLPVFLDVGTNNEALLNDPMYLGYPHPRVSQAEYDDFIDTFIRAVQKYFPNAFLHWEDFGRHNARRILNTYEDQLCTFNDDIQGTGAVTLAALLAACEVTGIPLEKNRIVVFGAGSAGTGISDQILDALMRKGLSKEEAYKTFWLIDRQGLLIETDTELTHAQAPYARSLEDLKNWSYPHAHPTLLDVIHHVKPTILIGCSAQYNAFSKEIVQAMAGYCERPIIFPLSNPDDKCEATPIDIIAWTNNQALIATGTGFPQVCYENQLISIAQCNNALVFPGIGLGILAVSAKRFSQEMVWAVAETLSTLSPARTDDMLPLLPPLTDAQSIAKKIAIAVAKTAIAQGLAQKNQDVDLEACIDALYWEPHYLPYKKIN